MAEMRLLLAAAAAGTVLSASGCSSFVRQDNPTQESRMEEITDSESGSLAADDPETAGSSETAGGAGEVPDEDVIETLPARFDYREIGKLPPAGDQGELGTCWAFASLMAMESTLLPEESWDFSEDHMSRMNSLDRKSVV